MSALPAPAPDDSVRIRPLGPPDAPLLDAVLDGMTPASRYARFHGPKPRLTSADRRFLAGTDGRDHLALVALDAAGEPIAIARSVRLQDRPRVAEIAAEVVDSRQRQGISTRLLTRLARQAAAVGIERFSACVLSSNPLAATLRRHGWRAVATDGLTVTLEIDVWRLAR